MRLARRQNRRCVRYLGTHRVRYARRLIPNSARSTRPHSVGVGVCSPFTSAAAARGERDGARARTVRKMAAADGTIFAAASQTGDRPDGRTVNRGVRTPKMRAGQISHLSFHARHLRVAIGDIGA